jgi:radical SAM protein with 4Fe4S-binding SPASM domain
MQLPILGQQPTDEQPDAYGFARVPESIERVSYGRFRNVYLYITDKCQLRCGHCYMGDRLEVGRVMPFSDVVRNMTVWRKMGGSKLSILGGEPTLHPAFVEIVRVANALGYEKVILNTNGLLTAKKRLRRVTPKDFAYVQVSLDGASPATHDVIRGKGTFDQAWATTTDLCQRGFDTRIICTVNRVNMEECLKLLPMAEQAGVGLVKYHVFSGIGLGTANDKWLVSPLEWVSFYEQLEHLRDRYKPQIWYQPTYARRERVEQFAQEGFRGCVGRTLDRISIFPDGRAYVCSYLFDTTLNFASMVDGRIVLNKAENEFDLFTSTLSDHSCGNCKVERICLGGCPAEHIVMGGSSCAAQPEIVPVCRLWKSDL